jgi:RNA recognition motif-containing protein
MGNRLYVGNLSFQTNTETIRAAFQAMGEVTDVHAVTDRETGQSRGFAFVTMGSASEAAKAIAEMNGAMLDGRALRVNEAEERQPRGGGGGFGGGGFRRWWRWWWSSRRRWSSWRRRRRALVSQPPCRIRASTSARKSGIARTSSAKSWPDAFSATRPPSGRRPTPRAK